MYKVTIESVGSFAHESLEDNFMIIFNNTAPQDIADYCFVHNHDLLKDTVSVGDKFSVGSNEYSITAVGEAVNQNLGSLGHITIRFDGCDSPETTGSLHVSGDKPEAISVGDVLLFTK